MFWALALRQSEWRQSYLLWRRANAQNVSFLNLSRWLFQPLSTHLIKPNFCLKGTTHFPHSRNITHQNYSQCFLIPLAKPLRFFKEFCKVLQWLKSFEKCVLWVHWKPPTFQHLKKINLRLSSHEKGQILLKSFAFWWLNHTYMHSVPHIGAHKISYHYLMNCKHIHTIKCMYWIVTQKSSIHINIFIVIVHFTNTLKHTWNKRFSGEDICGLFFFLRVSVAFNSKHKDLEHNKIIT